MKHLMKKIKIDPVSGCWICTLTKVRGGYARVSRSVDGKPRSFLAHRYAYEHLVGPIPEGLDLDHTCHDHACPSPGPDCPHRACCNPAHLEPTTRRENITRGQRPALTAASRSSATHCKKGHLFTAENTTMQGDYRRCRACLQAKEKRRQRDWSNGGKPIPSS